MFATRPNIDATAFLTKSMTGPKSIGSAPPPEDTVSVGMNVDPPPLPELLDLDDDDDDDDDPE